MPRSRPDFSYAHPRDITAEWDVPSNYAGPVLIWDLDKTYLATEFESLWGLMRTALEKPEKKRNISGTVSLLKHLRKDASPEKTTLAPLFFVSASPPQMSKKIAAKLHLDGITYTGIFYKDQWEHVKRGQFSRLRKHVGYKLIEILKIRARLPKGTSLILFGDDSEDDALTYSLLCDILDRALTGRALAHLLVDLGLERREALTLTRWQRDFPKKNPVTQVYINLIRHTDPMYYHKFGSIMTPTRSAFQIAICEFFAGRLSEEGVAAVAYEMHIQHGTSTFSLRKSAEDIVQRKGLAAQAEGHPLWQQLRVQKLLDEIPEMANEVKPLDLAIVRDPVHATNDVLKIRMKYYDELN